MRITFLGRTQKLYYFLEIEKEKNFNLEKSSVRKTFV